MKDWNGKPARADNVYALGREDHNGALKMSLSSLLSIQAGVELASTLKDSGSLRGYE